MKYFTVFKNSVQQIPMKVGVFIVRNMMMIAIAVNSIVIFNYSLIGKKQILILKKLQIKNR